MNLKEMYQSFLSKRELNTEGEEIDELHMFLPNASGDWEKDKYEFTKAYRELNLLNLEFGLPEEEDD